MDNNLILAELVRHRHARDLTEATPELLDVIGSRWGRCEAFSKCCSTYYTTQCDCRVILERKLATKPDCPSPLMRCQHERKFQQAMDFFGRLGLNDPEATMLLKHIASTKYDYGTDPLKEARQFYEYLKTDHSNEHCPTC